MEEVSGISGRRWSDGTGSEQCGGWQRRFLRFVRWYNGDFNESDLLGTTVGSAINAVKKWIYEVDHPLSGQPSGAEEKRLMAMERAFYVSFLEKLKKLSER